MYFAGTLLGIIGVKYKPLSPVRCKYKFASNDLDAACVEQQCKSGYVLPRCRQPSCSEIVAKQSKGEYKHG